MDSRAWLVNSRGLAKNVKNAEYQIKDCGANLLCPKCHYLIDNSDVPYDWPGLPAGVKFDPSDVELLQHLAAKCGVTDSKPHKFIDEFIPTLEGDDGICYTHPQNLPEAKKDGSSIHFFYRISNAYSTGERKRRKIQDETTNVRWHKTGKTKAIMEDGVVKGFKKIMVLYSASKQGVKPNKCNWVMHQFHVGKDEDEKQGEYVVSKVFYQNDKNEACLGIEEVIPRTPTPIPPSPSASSDDHFIDSLIQEPHPSHSASSLPVLKNEDEEYTPVNESSSPITTQLGNNSTDVFADLYSLELDTPPDFLFSDLQFASQDSAFDDFP